MAPLCGSGMRWAHCKPGGGSPLVLFVRRTTPRPAGTVSPIKGSTTRAHLLCLFDCQCTPILTKLQEKKPTPALEAGVGEMAQRSET